MARAIPHERAGRHGNRGARERSRDARREARNAVTSSPRMPRPFAAPGTRTHFVGDRPARLQHVRLEWDLDLARKRLSGTATLTLIARRDRLTALTFDAVELDVEAVTVDGRTAGFDNDGEKLRVVLPEPATEGAKVDVAIRYTCQPRRGLYFIGPNADHPERPLQCWTQGQDDDSRYYWPCIDHPIEKFTTEVICAAPAGNFVLSNGILRERLELPGDLVRWHYALEVPSAGVPGDAGGRPVRGNRRPRTAHRRRRLLLRSAGTRGRRAPQLPAHARDDRLLLGAHRPRVPVERSRRRRRRCAVRGRRSLHNRQAASVTRYAG